MKKLDIKFPTREELDMETENIKKMGWTIKEEVGMGCIVGRGDYPSQYFFDPGNTPKTFEECNDYIINPGQNSTYKLYAAIQLIGSFKETYNNLDFYLDKIKDSKTKAYFFDLPLDYIKCNIFNLPLNTLLINTLMSEEKRKQIRELYNSYNDLT